MMLTETKVRRLIVYTTTCMLEIQASLEGIPRCLLLIGNVFIFNKTRIDAVF